MCHTWRMETVTILHSNDIHGRVEQFGPIGAMVAHIRRESGDDPVLYFDVGDSEEYANRLSSLTKGVAMHRILAAAGCQAVAVGNACLARYGPKSVTEQAAASPYPHLAANIHDRNGRLIPGVKASTIIQAGGLSLGLGIVDFGVAEHYLGQLDWQGAKVISLMLVFGFITVALSNVMSNTATASILIPIAGVLLVEKAPVVTIMIALSASAALMLPVSTPPNAIAFSTEMIKARDFRFGGFLIGGVTPLLVCLWVWILWSVRH